METNNREYDFLKFYMAQTWEEMRHIEQLRVNVSSLIMGLATLISGFIVQQNFKAGTGILAVFLVVLGLFGAIMTRKLYQLHQSDQKRLDYWHRYIQECIPGSKVIEYRDKADNEHKYQFPFLANMRHNHFWFVLHLLISIGGLVMLGLILFS